MQRSIRLLFAVVVVLIFPSALVSRASTITAVTFSGTALDPTISIYGTAFGSAPAPTAVAFAGYTGLDYGTDLHIRDSSTNPLFDAGYDDPGAGFHDIIGLTDLVYTDTFISFKLGSVYETYPVRFNEGDTFTAFVGSESFTGNVAYTPEPSSIALLGNRPHRSSWSSPASAPSLNPTALWTKTGPGA